jgi:phosphate transport system permease protein
MKIKYLYERIIEGIIYASGWLTTLVVLAIILFLFREGVGLFSKSPLEEGYGIVANVENKVTELSAKQIRDIFEKNIENWKDLGGADEKIVIFSLSNIDKYYKERDLGESFSLLPEKIKEFVSANKGVIAVFPAQYLGKSLKKIEITPISFWSFIGGKDWYPTSTPAAQLGVLAIILGTLWVSLGAMIFALPIGIGVAIYMAEVADKRVREWLKPFIELLAGIPSVVFGFFGLVYIVPLLQTLFNLPVGETALAGSILLGIMALPTIITLSEDAIRSVPRELKEASFALGANHWQSIVRVIVPYAKSGVISACILGVGRAIGETMAVLMVTGNAAVIPTSFLEPVRTITATIASELGEAQQGGTHYEALFLLGSILFMITFLVNWLAELVTKKSKI